MKKNNENIVAALVSDLTGLGEGWSYNVVLSETLGRTKLVTKTIDPNMDIDSNGRLGIFTNLTTKDVNQLVIQEKTSKTFADIYKEYNNPVNLSCYSADTTNYLTVPYLYLTVEFFKNGENTITKNNSRSSRTYFYECNGDVDNGEIRNHIANNQDDAIRNKVSCLTC